MGERKECSGPFSYFSGKPNGPQKIMGLSPLCVFA